MDIDKIKKGLKIFAIVVLIIIFINVLNRDYFNGNNDDIKVQKAFDSSVKDPLLDEPSDDEYIYMHITGEIKKPGVYKMKDGSRMDDLVKEAGGLTDDADIDQINLSEKLVDEERIIIPSKSDASASDVTAHAASTAKASKVNINTADITELMTLPGFGEKTAQKIIDYREKKKFKKIEDIMNIDGIGEKKFKKIKDYIIVSGR